MQFNIFQAIFIFYISFRSVLLRVNWITCGPKIASSLPIDFIVHVSLLKVGRHVSFFFPFHMNQLHNSLFVCIVWNVFLNCCRCISETFLSLCSVVVSTDAAAVVVIVDDEMITRVSCKCSLFNVHKAKNGKKRKEILVTKYENVS